MVVELDQCESLPTKLIWRVDGKWAARLLFFLPRFVSCLLEQPEVLVVGAGRGHAGRIIHKLFVNAQRVRTLRLLTDMPWPRQPSAQWGAVWIPTHGCFPSCRPSVSLGIAFRCCFRVCLRKRITKFQKGLKSVVTESDRDSVANGQSCAVGKNVANFQIRTGLSFTGQTPCTANGFTASLWS